MITIRLCLSYFSNKEHFNSTRITPNSTGRIPVSYLASLFERDRHGVKPGLLLMFIMRCIMLMVLLLLHALSMNLWRSTDKYQENSSIHSVWVSEHLAGLRLMLGDSKHHLLWTWLFDFADLQTAVACPKPHYPYKRRCPVTNYARVYASKSLYFVGRPPIML